jgi:hypothetical protein
MLELYVILTLGAIGYLLNQSSTNGVKSKQSYSKNEKPSMDTAYTSKYADQTLRITGEKATKMYDQSQNPKNSGVISKNYNFLKENKEDLQQNKIMSLSGEYIDKSDFTHNNQVPFFGGSVKQSLEPFVNDSIMLNHIGNDSLYQQKKEVKSFYDSCQDVGNVNGMKNNNDYYRDRIAEPRVKNNVFPIPQVYVGPGLNKGFTAEPTGGYQQFDMRDYVQFKTVDELRVANKPKTTFDGVTLDGMKAKVRGDIGVVEKNRPERFWEQTPDMWFTTTGAVTKQMEKPDQLVKDTNRQDTTAEYMGAAYGYDQQGRANDPDVRGARKPQFGELGLANPAGTIYGKGNNFDHGKSKILVYNNERDITSTRVYQGNLTSLIKSIIAPVTDMIKVTRKDDMINNPRHYGNMSIQIPSKQTMYDPNDIARVTIKETLIHDATINNLTGPKQLTVYDPDDIARTTLREAMDQIDTSLNLAGKPAVQAYNDDPAKTTLKETLIDGERYGNPDRFATGLGGGGYETNEYDARTTQKQFLSDNDYIGQAGRDLGHGYETNEYDARTTQKQFLSDNDYYGTAVASSDKKQMSYDDKYNAHITSNKETTLFGREPTNTGTKDYVGKEGYDNMAHKKTECDYRMVRETQNSDRVYNEIPSTDEVTSTKMKKMYRQPDDERLDIGILKATLDNPLNIDLAARLK